jgi:hypothetical protein
MVPGRLVQHSNVSEDLAAPLFGFVQEERFFPLKLEVAGSSEMFVPTYKSKRRHILLVEDGILSMR